MDKLAVAISVLIVSAAVFVLAASVAVLHDVGLV